MNGGVTVMSRTRGRRVESAGAKHSAHHSMGGVRQCGAVALAVVAALLISGMAAAQTPERESESFAWYQWFVECAGGGFSWFRTGECFEGPVHVNGDICIDGDPWFGTIVTAGGGLTLKPGSNPTFEEGYMLNLDPVELPSVTDIHATVKAAAISGGVYGATLGNNTYYEVELGVPSAGHFTCAGFDRYGNPIGLNMVIEIAALNGAAWFEEPIKIFGVLDGMLTIGVNGNIEIMDDVLYEGSTPGIGPNPDCDDMLGLIAAGSADGDIIVSYTAPNQSDCEIHAVMMALQKNFEVEDYMHHPLRGELTLHGGVIVDYAILTGEYVDGIVISGYVRDLHYDARMSDESPPFFPRGTFPMGVPEIAATNLALSLPNPFSGATTIRFSAPQGSWATVEVYDVAGRRVATLFDGVVRDGSDEVRWDARGGGGEGVASGIYFIRMEAGGEVVTRKSVLLR